MTGVLLLGDVPSTGLAGTSAERVALSTARAPGHPAEQPDGHDPRRDHPLGTFVDLVAQRLDQAGAVLAVYPAWRREPAGHYVRFARSALETEDLVGVASSLPPLALSLMVDQLAYLAPYVPPGVLVGLASRLADDILAGAWVRSVARLEHVGASLGHHLRSYLPGGFMVTASPGPAVHRITGRAPVNDLPFRPADPVQLLATHEDGDTRWFRDTLLPNLRPGRVQFFQPQPFSGTYWGTRRYVEYAAFSAHPQALSYAAGSVRVRRCRWCERVVATPTCPFCGMTRHRAGRRAGSHRPAAPTTAPTAPGTSAAAVPPRPRAPAPPAPARTSRLTAPAGPGGETGPLPSTTEPGSGVP